MPKKLKEEMDDALEQYYGIGCETMHIEHAVRKHFEGTPLGEAFREWFTLVGVWTEQWADTHILQFSSNVNPTKNGVLSLTMRLTSEQLIEIFPKDYDTETYRRVNGDKVKKAEILHEGKYMVHLYHKCQDCE